MVRFYKSQKIIFKLHWIFFLIRIHCYFHFHLCKTQLKGSCLSALELNFLFVLFPSLVPVSVSSVKTRTGKLFLEIWRQCVPISPWNSMFIFSPFLSKLWFARTISLQSPGSRIWSIFQIGSQTFGSSRFALDQQNVDWGLSQQKSGGDKLKFLTK